MKKRHTPLIMIIYALLIIGMVYGVFVNTEYEDLGWICMIVGSLINGVYIIRNAKNKMNLDNKISSKIWFGFCCLIEAVFAVCLIIWIVRLFR
ncbi:MAG: hypothetical protein IJB73_06675 [Firmicutes bacterium]|nr:hypothetical protein [Bacillota bacterium]